MIRVLRWLVDYWYIPVLVVVAIVVSVVGRRLLGIDTKDLEDLTASQLREIEAKRAAREAVLAAGREQATRQVQEKYAAAYARLDEQQAARVKVLENDPERLAVALERLSR